MWFLERKKDGKTIYLLCNKEYTVGRKCCTVIVSEDVSVSRKHLAMQVGTTNGTEKPPLKIKDLGSTYGTYINPTSALDIGKIEPNVWVEVKNESVLHFGVANEWIVKWKDVIVLCSAMAPASRTRLASQLVKLGAHQLKDWNESITHLVMEKVVFTQKVMQCLIAAKPILGFEYFEAWTVNLENDPSAEPPDIAAHIPRIDSQLSHFDQNLFLPQIKRRKIFQGKTFGFSTPEQYASMSSCVTSAGGTARHISDINLDPDTLLVEHSGGTPSSDYMLKFNELKQLGRRVIPMKDIGLAVLHCSTERYCNQTFHLEQTLFGNLSVQQQQKSGQNQPTILAPETQVGASTSQRLSIQEPPSKKLKAEIIPESPVKEPLRGKRCFEQDLKEETVAISNENEETQPIIKRKSSRGQRLSTETSCSTISDGDPIQETGTTSSQSAKKIFNLPAASRPCPRSKKLLTSGSTLIQQAVSVASVEENPEPERLEMNEEDNNVSKFPAKNQIGRNAELPPIETVKSVKRPASPTDIPDNHRFKRSMHDAQLSVKRQERNNEPTKKRIEDSGQQMKTDMNKTKKNEKLPYSDAIKPAVRLVDTSLQSIRSDAVNYSTISWDRRKDHSALSESFSKMAVRVKLLRDNNSVNASSNETTSSWKSSCEMVKSTRLHTMKVACYREGKWKICQNLIEQQ